MKTVAIHDAKTNLSKYIAAAKKGEIIYIGSHGKPEVKLVVTKPADIASPNRKLGPLAGKMWVSPDAFSQETDEEIAKLMYNDDE